MLTLREEVQVLAEEEVYAVKAKKAAADKAAADNAAADKGMEFFLYICCYMPSPYRFPGNGNSQ